MKGCERKSREESILWYIMSAYDYVSRSVVLVPCPTIAIDLPPIFFFSLHHLNLGRSTDRHYIEAKMVRKLKYHEQKLLRKTDFITYKSDGGHREALVRRRYMIQKPEDYHGYNRLCGTLRQLAHRLSLMPAENATRQRLEKLLLEKLQAVGILKAGLRLSQVEHEVTVSAFARRRLAVVMTRLHMADTVQTSTKMIEQGHVRVGTETVTDPAFLVTRDMEDFVTWSVGSKIKRNIMQYRDKLDDFELL
jgi:U3 small nucleolar ribonucleoprotein protein IMP3